MKGAILNRLTLNGFIRHVRGNRMTERVGDMQQRAKGKNQAVGTQLVYILTELAGCPKIVF